MFPLVYSSQRLLFFYCLVVSLRYIGSYHQMQHYGSYMKYYFSSCGLGLGSPPWSADECQKISQVNRSNIILIKPVLDTFGK